MEFQSSELVWADNHCEIPTLHLSAELLEGIKLLKILCKEIRHTDRVPEYAFGWNLLFREMSVNRE